MSFWHVTCSYGNHHQTSWRRLEDVLKRFLQDVLKMSWRRFCKTSWRRFENVLKSSWQDFLKTSWKRLEDALRAFGQDKYIGLDQDILKTSWRRHMKTKMKDVFKTSSSRRMSVGIQINMLKNSSFSKILSPKLLDSWWDNLYVQLLVIISYFMFSLLHGYGFSRKLSE